MSQTFLPYARRRNEERARILNNTQWIEGRSPRQTQMCVRCGEKIFPGVYHVRNLTYRVHCHSLCLREWRENHQDEAMCPPGKPIERSTP